MISRGAVLLGRGPKPRDNPRGGAVLLDRDGPPRAVGSADLDALTRELRVGWQDRLRAIEESGVPMASRQYFEELMEPVVVAAHTALTGTTEGAMWAMSGASPPPPTLIPANTVRPGQILAVRAWGAMTTPASAATTMTITPRWGTTSSGTSLGASSASNTAVASRTADPWFLDFTLTIRAVGATGSAVGAGRFTSPAIGTAAANPGTLVFGATIATIDTTVAAGLYMGATLGGSAGWSLATYGLAFEYLN